MYNVTEKGKLSIINVLKTKPFQEVVDVINLLSGKPELTNDEASSIINFMSRYPYYEVSEILDQKNLSEIFLILKYQKQEEEKEVVDRYEIIKDDINPNEE